MLKEQLPWHVRYRTIAQWQAVERLFATGEEKSPLVRLVDPGRRRLGGGHGAG